MMEKFINIIKEYQKTVDLEWRDIPPSIDSKPVGHIISTQYVIKAAQDSTGVSFWLSYNNIDIAFVEIIPVGKYVALHQAFVLPEYQNKGLMSELIHWIIRTKKQPLINDTQMSEDGLALWNKLMRVMSPKIVDISTNVTFDIDDPKIMKPEMDNAQPNFYDPDTGIGQRYFYLIEAPEWFYHISEGVEHKFSCDIKRHAYRLRAGLFQTYFKDGDA